MPPPNPLVSMFKMLERNIPPGSKPPLAQRKREDTTFLVGSVRNVDPDRWAMDVDLFDGQGPRNNISIAQPFAGTSSYMAGMPDKGATVILGQQKNFLYPIAYLPNYSAATESKTLKLWPDDILTEDKNVFSYRIKRLKPGELAIGSSGGSEILLNNLLGLVSGGSSLTIEGKTDSIVSTSLTHSLFGAGVWHNEGIIKRNSLTRSNVKDGHYAHDKKLDNQKVIYNLRPGSNDSHDPYFTEYLLEVEDTALGDIPINDVNAEKNRTYRNPIAVFSLGNYVGNNSDKPGTYAKVLGIKLFKDVNDDYGDITFTALTGKDYLTKALAVTLFKPERRNSERGAFFGIDKEGHFYQYIPAATGGGLGQGRSMSIVARGNKKEVWGMDAREGNSWDINLKGGIKWVIGNHNDRDGNTYKGRSIDMRMTGSVYVQAGVDFSKELKDIDNDRKTVDPYTYKKIERIDGRERIEVNGTRESIIGGGDKLQIGGLKREVVGGAYTLLVGANMGINSDSFSESVTKEKQESFGSRKTVILKGSSELIVKSIKGDITEEIALFGDKRTKINVGSILESVFVGSREFKTTSGGYRVNVGAGDISMNTKAGNVAIGSTIGKVSINGSIGIGIKTSMISTVSVEGGSINLRGRTFATTGVITSLTHRDYVTGAPLVGSRTVKATM